MKGYLLLGSELAALATNIGAFVAAERLRGADGFYAPSDAKTARRLRTVQYVSLGVLGALLIYGVLDAVLNFEPEEQRIEVGPCKAPSAIEGAPGLVHYSMCVGFSQ